MGKMSMWRAGHMVLVAGAVAGLSACTAPIVTVGGDRPEAASGYQAQQIRPRPPWFSRYMAGAEQDLVNSANMGQQRGGRPQLFVASRLTTLARAQSARMAARGAATFTDEDRAAMKNVISPSSLPPRDYWVFVNRARADASTDAAHALINTGPRPFISYNFYFLKPNFNALGVGVYWARDRNYYGTIIVVEHEAR